MADTLKMGERELRDGFLRVARRKTGANRRIEVTTELTALLARIASKKSGAMVHAARLIVAEDGQPLTYRLLTHRLASAREAAGVAPDAFQFRELRTTAGNDKADSAGDIREFQKQLGHSSVVMTEAYTRNRRGAKVTPQSRASTGETLPLCRHEPVRLPAPPIRKLALQQDLARSCTVQPPLLPSRRLLGPESLPLR